MADLPFGKPHVVNGDEGEDETYDPSTAQVNRGREQGLGVGARDLARQRDPTVPDAGPEQDDDAEDGEPTR